jgi:DNA-binding CsgD family transcriptional regulator
MISDKDREIIELMALGMPKDEISLNLGVSKRTVERTFVELRATYGAKNNVSLYSVATAELMAGELMATLETVLTYCPNLEVKREARKRLTELENKYK